MRCVRCGTENPTGFAFCGGCGTQFVLICPRCAFQSPLGFTFCGQCGAPLTTHRDRLTPDERDHLRMYLPVHMIESLSAEVQEWPSPLLAQCIAHLSTLMETIYTLLPSDLISNQIRDPTPGQAGGRFVQGSLLFADISGFTAMSELLSRGGREGAEEVTGIVNRCFSSLLAILRDHDGQLIRFGGDALLGLFQGSASATLAVQAALRMQAAMAEFAQTRTSQGLLPLSMKVAVHRGQFFAASLGSRHHLEYALFGADVNTTAAIEGAAARGEVVVDQTTLDALTVPYQGSRAVSGYFSVTEIEPAPATSPSEFHAVPDFQPTLADLRRATLLLDALTPYLPAGLLTRLAHDPHALSVEGEHRLVAVLFANVHGLGTIVDRLGPGQEATLIAILNQYFLLMAEAVEQFGGVINKIDLAEHGDKIVVLFGAPQTHEDDAERAVRAGLAMQAALEHIRCTLPQQMGMGDLCLEQQIGINYGYVFAGYVGTRWRHEYTVMGDEVNLAARIMTVSSSGTVSVSSAVQHCVQAFFALTSRGEVRLKGKSAPVPIFDVVGIHAVPQPVRGREWGRTPLVGRQREWELLAGVGGELHHGRGRILLMTGEAGIGKSRLLEEFCAHMATTGAEAVRWVESHCHSYTEHVSYGPFLAVVRTIVGIGAHDDEHAAMAKLRMALADLPRSDVGAHDLYLAHFLALPLDETEQARVRYLDAQALQRRTFVAITALVDASVRRAGAMILALEDIHWMDHASLELLEHLLTLPGRLPLLLLLLYRPDIHKGAWGLSEKAVREFAPWTTVITLRPLNPEESDRLVGDMVHLTHWPPALRNQIVARAEGNPLYLEELIKMLVDDQVLRRDAHGIWQIHGDPALLHVPISLEGVLMARLDQLDELVRWTAQVASVIGRAFPFGILDTISEDRHSSLTRTLVELQRYDLVYESWRVPEPNYSFKHVIIRDVCYQSLLAQVRRRYHRAIATAMAANEDNLEQHAALIAYHAFVGRDWPCALRCHLVAGRQALRLYANRTAIEHYTQALTCLSHRPPGVTDAQRLEIHTALGELLTITGEYESALEQLGAARRLADELGDQDAQAHACRGTARLYELRGDYPAALDWIAHGLAVLGVRETDETAQLLLIAGLIAVRQGDRARAQAQGQRALQIAERQGALAVLARAYNLLGVTMLGSTSAAAVDHFQQAFRLYTGIGDLAGQALAQNQIANACFDLGQWHAARDHYAQARDHFQQLGDVYNGAVADNNLGEIALNQGRLDDAVREYQHAVTTLERIGGSAWLLGLLHNNIGATYIRRHDAATARQHLRMSEQLFAQAGSRDFLAEMHRHGAAAALLADDLDEAEAQGLRALELAHEQALRSEEGYSLRVLGETATAQGRLDLAEARLQESRTILDEVGDVYAEARTRLALAALYRGQGRTADAQEILEPAIAVFDHLEAGLDLAAAQSLHAELLAVDKHTSAHTESEEHDER